MLEINVKQKLALGEIANGKKVDGRTLAALQRKGFVKTKALKKGGTSIKLTAKAKKLIK